VNKQSSNSVFSSAAQTSKTRSLCPRDSVLHNIQLKTIRSKITNLAKMQLLT